MKGIATIGRNALDISSLFLYHVREFYYENPVTGCINNFRRRIEYRKLLAGRVELAYEQQVTAQEERNILYAAFIKDGSEFILAATSKDLTSLTKNYGHCWDPITRTYYTTTKIPFLGEISFGLSRR